MIELLQRTWIWIRNFIKGGWAPTTHSCIYQLIVCYVYAVYWYNYAKNSGRYAYFLRYELFVWVSLRNARETMVSNFRCFNRIVQELAWHEPDNSSWMNIFFVIVTWRDLGKCRFFNNFGECIVYTAIGLHAINLVTKSMSTCGSEGHVLSMRSVVGGRYDNKKMVRYKNHA